MITLSKIIKSNANNAEIKSKLMRAKRNNLLDKTDWFLNKFREHGGTLPSDYISFRQALRDLPENPDFPNVEMPIAKTEWLKQEV